MTDDRLTAFLILVPTARWTDVPNDWSEELRRALSDGLVKVGWGGVLELTDDGRVLVPKYKAQRRT